MIVEWHPEYLVLSVINSKQVDNNREAMLFRDEARVIDVNERNIVIRR